MSNEITYHRRKIFTYDLCTEGVVIFTACGEQPTPYDAGVGVSMNPYARQFSNGAGDMVTIVPCDSCLHDNVPLQNL